MLFSLKVSSVFRLSHMMLSSAGRISLITVRVLTVSVGLSLTTTMIIAEEPERQLIRVEEDWVALVAQPDPSTSSPQILNVISPTQSTSGIFGLIQVNHRDQPTFYEGGLQVQARRDSEFIAAAQARRTSVLSRSNDSLRYTVGMQLTETGIRFELLNGSSRTWGKFAETPVSVSVAASGLTLEDYSPEFSAENSCVNLGAHRIELLYLNTTRRIFDDGEVVTDTSNRVLHRYQLKVEDVSLSAYEQNPEDYTMDITDDTAPTGP